MQVTIKSFQGPEKGAQGGGDLWSELGAEECREVSVNHTSGIDGGTEGGGKKWKEGQTVGW